MSLAMRGFEICLTLVVKVKLKICLAAYLARVSRRVCLRQRQREFRNGFTVGAVKCPCTKQAADPCGMTIQESESVSECGEE